MIVKFSRISTQECVCALKTYGVYIKRGFLDSSFAASLVRELSAYTPKAAPPVFGRQKCLQNFSQINDLSPNASLRLVAEHLAGVLDKQFLDVKPRPYQKLLQFDEIRVEIYPVSKLGIGYHRDQPRYVKLAALLILEGKADFCVANDIHGAYEVVSEAKTGDLILMSAADFYKARCQPLHALKNIKSTLTLASFRQNRDLVKIAQP